MQGISVLIGSITIGFGSPFLWSARVAPQLSFIQPKYFPKSFGINSQESLNYAIVRDKFEALYTKEEKYLIDFNYKTHSLILEIFKSNKNIILSKKYENKSLLKDFRNYSFHTNEKINYDQVFSINHGFIKNLSIIDLLFNIGPESIDIINKIDSSKIY